MASSSIAEQRISLVTLRRLAARVGVCVSVVCDPSADVDERWIASVGLDAFGAGSTPTSALADAVAAHRRAMDSYALDTRRTHGGWDPARVGA